MKKLVSRLFILTALMTVWSLSAHAQQNVNLIPDASFEVPAPAWFKEGSGTDYYLAKNPIADAPDGKQVLELSAWNESGTKVLSSPLDAPAGSLTLTVCVRAINPATEGKLTIALLDEAGKKEIGRFGEIELGNAAVWKVFSGTVATPGGKVVVALLPGGSANGMVIQLDKLGVFAGTTAGDVKNNVDWQVVEAESLANGKTWAMHPDYRGWYYGVPSRKAMLVGYNGVTSTDNVPAIANLEVQHAGPHVLWLRVLYTTPAYIGAFTVSLRQNDELLAERTIESSDASISPEARRLNWVWVPVKANLRPGQVSITLSRPNGACTATARNIDLLLLTNLTDYQPDISDFSPRLFVRWTNTGSGEPYCLWSFIRRNANPFYAMPGMLNAAGLSRSNRVPAARGKWIGPGQRTPWCDFSSFLLPDGQFNQVQLLATRELNTTGLVEGTIKGTLEFTLGPEKKIIRTVSFDQNAPRILLGVSGDLSQTPLEIQTGYDSLQAARAALPPFHHSKTPAKYLDLVTILSLQRGMDDPALLDGEFQNLAEMGFNGTYTANFDKAHPEAAGDFYRKHGMQTRYGIGSGVWHLIQNNDVTQPDMARISQQYQTVARDNAVILPDVVRMKLADEPMGPSYETLVKSDTAQQQFREFLQQQKVHLADLNVATWDQVHTVTEKEKKTAPALFYYSGLFRLQVPANLTRTMVTEKKKHFSDNVKMYVNYSPPFSWTERGTDPFFMQRYGGLEMGWSEDWLALNASPQYTADTYALLRAAGQGQTLGGYMVGGSGGTLQRLKYYTMVAGGAREICVYSYGPAYAGIDSWSLKYDFYPVLRNVQFELGKIDGALNGTKRRPTQIAILYNRTAGIWSGSDSSAEQDVRFIRWALAHAGYDADIIPEEDIVAGKLDRYKVLYIGGIELRLDAAQKIAAWVQNGGTLFGAAGAATRDEFSRPQTALENVFGARSENLKMVSNAGSPKYTLRTQKVLATLQSIDPQQPVQLDQLCYSETLQPFAAGKTLFKDASGAVMGTQNTFGKGTAFRVAALPGLAYLNRAIRDNNYDVNTFLPSDFDPALRDFLSLPARLAKVTPVAQSNLNSSEITRYDAPGRSVIFVVNYAGNQKQDFSMLVPDANWATKAYCADGEKVVMSKAANGMTRIGFPLNTAGAVVLEK